MANQADTRKLRDRSGGECPFPGCDTRENLEEAHIIAKRARGARGTEALPRGIKLNSYENLIVLCPTHHRLVDGDRKVEFRPETLRDVKANHERDVASRRQAVTELAGRIETEGRDADKVVGVKIYKPTRFAPGTQVRTTATGAKEVTGIQIGG